MNAKDNHTEHLKKIAMAWGVTSGVYKAAAGQPVGSFEPYKAPRHGRYHSPEIDRISARAVRDLLFDHERLHCPPLIIWPSLTYPHGFGYMGLKVIE